jgi:hypothetical protein
VRRQGRLGFIVRGSYSALDGRLVDLRDHESGGLEGDIDGPAELKWLDRLRLQRNAGPDAGADLPRPQDPAADMTSNQVRERVEPYVRQALPEGWINGKTVWHINPTGKFYIGGPDGDAGLTGRKIIVDTYGGAAPHVGASARGHNVRPPIMAGFPSADSLVGAISKKEVMPSSKWHPRPSIGRVRPKSAALEGKSAVRLHRN